MPIYTKVNNEMKKISAIKTKYNGEMVDIKRIMTKLNGQMVTIFSHVSELIKEFFGYPIQTAYSLAGDLINWKLYGNSVQRLLPEGFTQLEYIESTGEQYIDTGINKAKFIHDMKFTVKNDTNLMGNSTSGGSYWGQNRSATDGFELGVQKIFTNSLVRQKITFDTNSEQSILIANNTTVRVNNTVGNQTYCLFRINDKSFYCSARAWSLEAYDQNNTLVGNFIPAKRKSDNEVGMYDTITKAFKPNAGTGSFVAGPEAPTPDSPIEIKSVGDRTKNLLNPENFVYGRGYRVGDGTSSSNAGFSNSGSVKVKPSTTYSTNFNKGSNGTFGLCFYEADNTFISGISLSTGFSTFTTPANCDNVILTTQESQSAFEYNKYLVEGSVVPTSFIPYGYQIPVKVSGKNLFDKTKYNQASSWIGVNYKYIEIPLPNGTYTIHWDISKGRSGIYLLLQLDGSVKGTSSAGTGGTWLYHADIPSLQKDTFTFTVTEGYVYLTCSYGAYFNYLADIVDTIQIVEGSTAPTEYIPYYKSTTPVYLSNPLRKVGTYADYIDYENQQVVRNVGYKVLDGTESWVFGTMSPQVNSIYLVISDMMEGLRQAGVCTHFINTQNIIDGGIWFGRNSKQIYILSSSFTSVEVAKAYLASEYANGTPVIIAYPLATPVTEPLTVPALTLSEGTNIITAETATSPSDMYAKGKVSQL